MIAYNVMLEGRDKGKGFLITLEVAGPSQSYAEKLALDEARKMELKIIGIEEVSFKRRLKSSAEPGILKVYGKAYFELEEPE